MTQSRIAPIRLAGKAYVQIFRSISPYIYILWLYFGLTIMTGIDLTALWAGVIGLTLLYTAYMAEILRSGIASIDKGQIDAGQALGLHRAQIFLLVLAPQLLRIVLPPLFAVTVILFKDSSLVSVIGAKDVMYNTKALVGNYDKPLFFYSVAALF